MIAEKTNLAPIVLFGYNRPKHIKKTLEALSKNDLASNSELFIFIDWYKNNSDQNLNLEVLNICENFQWPGISKVINHRNTNFGLAKNILSGVTEIVNKFGKVIVIEDDIETAPEFLKYMNNALFHFHNEKKVMHINGFNPETRFQSLLPNLFFTRFMNCWGWATWADRWEKYRDNASELYTELISRKDHQHYNFHGSAKFDQQLIDNIEGKINTWAVKWNATVFIENGLCLTPKISMVANCGLDGTGTHYKDKNPKGNNSDIQKLGHAPDIRHMDVQKESKFSRIYLGLHYALGRNPSNLHVIKYLTRRILTKGIL